MVMVENQRMGVDWTPLPTMKSEHKYSPVRNSLEYISDDEGEFSDESRGSGMCGILAQI